jgi:hypothetical protein
MRGMRGTPGFIKVNSENVNFRLLQNSPSIEVSGSV